MASEWAEAGRERRRKAALLTLSATRFADSRGSTPSSGIAGAPRDLR